ncbi:MAG: 8-oxo-dGTP diphosphatase MutT [Clostridiaceae bacterium]|nr:8-oxo-dGTP diphosphatase MutT [Clostridiaceae bacterium]
MNIVTAAVMIRDGKVLIAQRQAGSHMEYRWEFPGGKLEPYETPEECIVREIKEEMDIDIEVIDIYKAVKFKYDDRDILLLCYLCRILKGDGKALECNDFRWVTKDELKGFDFVPADLPIIEKLINDKRL